MSSPYLQVIFHMMHNSLLMNNCKLRCAWGSKATPNPDQFTDGLRFFWKAVYCNCGQTSPFSLGQQKHKTCFVWECSFVVFMKMIMKSKLFVWSVCHQGIPYICTYCVQGGYGFANMENTCANMSKSQVPWYWLTFSWNEKGALLMIRRSEEFRPRPTNCPVA